ncbi:MAG TPA: XdhC/CoxI family protein [Alphaproteobacteria bacterium]|nr:XdhC/CoxI family protein [Alphaproteobacteria bacterium]
MTAANSDLDILRTAYAWLNDGHAVSIATVVQTWGSAPRPAGSLLAIKGDGTFLGSVSGGCIEGAVIAEAREVMAAKRHKVLTFGVSDDTAWSVGLACGGTIEVLVEPLENSGLSAVLAAAERGDQAVRAINLTTGAILGAQDLGRAEGLGQAAATAVRSARSMMADTAGDRWFLHIQSLPISLVIAGAVHIAQDLFRIADIMGWRVTIVDPRTAFASADRFPRGHILTSWPDEALSAMQIGPRTAIVTLTHDPKLDDPALETALRSSAFYIGALGSKKTHAGRLDRLAAKGFTAQDMARIHGPIGLDIGARAPSEIALAIAAQIVATAQRP